MSHGRLQKAEAALQDEVARWLETAEGTDAREDAEFARDRSGGDSV